MQLFTPLRFLLLILLVPFFALEVHAAGPSLFSSCDDLCTTDSGGLSSCQSGSGGKNSGGYFQLHNSNFLVTADAIFLAHSGSAFRSEILDPGNGSVTVAQELEHGFPVAPRVQGIVRLLDDLYVAATYFGTDEWDSSAQIRNVPPLPDLSADIAYAAELQNVEVNFLRGTAFADTYWLLGVRYLTYQDSFIESYRLDSAFSPTINEVVNGEAENVLLGPQLGLLLNYGIGQTQLRIGSKVGLMNNRVDQLGPAYTNAITIDGNPETTFQNEEDQFALLGDLNVTVERHFTQHLSFRAGYQGIFLDNIAQSATQNGQVATPDTLWVHGALFGVNLSW